MYNLEALDKLKGNFKTLRWVQNNRCDMVHLDHYFHSALYMVKDDQEEAKSKLRPKSK
jgi:hypothetical protein